MIIIKVGLGFDTFFFYISKAIKTTLCVKIQFKGHLASVKKTGRLVPVSWGTRDL